MNPALSTDCDSSTLQGARPSSGWKASMAKQFGRPDGRLGRLAGLIMSVNNKARSLWVLSLLSVEPIDRVLEIGFGPGQDLKRINAIATEGLTAGVDHSPEMVKMARAKNLRAIHAGRADIRQGSADRIPFPDACFTKAFSINSVQFWGDRRAALREIRRVLRPGGHIAIALEPRGASSPELAAENGKTIAADLAALGFANVRLESNGHAKKPAVCVLGLKAACANGER
jgi:SAM-dependent methyltransferase